jgi:hypothetical protein
MDGWQLDIYASRSQPQGEPMLPQTSSLTIEQLLVALPENIRPIVSNLHDIARAQHCQYHIEAPEEDGRLRVKYSGMDLTVQIDGENLTLYPVMTFVLLWIFTAPVPTRRQRSCSSKLPGPAVSVLMIIA